MYLKFYGLSEKPFSQTPDPRFLYWNDSYREALASLRYGIQERKGFLTMIGEAGTGKTTLLRKLLDDLGPDAVSVLLFNPNASFEEILEYTLSELGVMVPSGRKLAMLQRLNEFLLAAFAEGKNTILVIDEAQDLETEVLESLRLLSNLETSREKILQIVLSGQPELATRLAQENLRQLKQRIAVRCRLEPLQRSELVEYIWARLRVAGGDEGLFQESSLDGIWRFANGIPRLVNTVCDNALLVGYALGKRQIDGEVVEEVVQDLSRLDAPEDTRRPAEPAAGAVEPRPAARPPEARPAAPPSPALPEAPAQDGSAARVEPASAPSAPLSTPSPPGKAMPTASPASAASAVPFASRGRLEEGGRSRSFGGTLTVAVGAIILLAGGIWLGMQLRPPGGPKEIPAIPTGSRPLAGDVRQSDTAPPAGSRLGAERFPPERQVEGVPAPEPEAPSGDAAPPQEAVVQPQLEGAGEKPVAVRGEPPTQAPSSPHGDRQGSSPDGETAVPSAPPRVADSAAADRRASVVELPAGPADVRGELSARPSRAEGQAPTGNGLTDTGTLPTVRADEPAALAHSRGSRHLPDSQDVQDSGSRVLADGQRILVRPGDTLYQLAWRTYGAANFTTLDMLRAANPDVQDVNRIVAGRILVFPDPGPEARIVEADGSQSVLALTTPVADQAQGVQRKLQEQFGERVEVEPVTLGEGQRLYRVSLTKLHGESQARAIAESLGTILNDPQERPGS